MDSTVAVAAVVELFKLAIQYQVARARAAGLSEEQILGVLQGERERFKRNIAEPLPDV